MLSLYRDLLTLRRQQVSLSIGTMNLIDAPHGILAYERCHGEQVLRVILNLTSADVACSWEGIPLFSTCNGKSVPGKLRPNEGLIIA